MNVDSGGRGLAKETNVEVGGCSGKIEEWDRWWRRGADGDR